MSSPADKGGAATAEKDSPSGYPQDGTEVVSVELQAPVGWKKKYTPKKPRRNEIVFISPTGEEIKGKRPLDQYLKSHPGGPSLSEFDWGTGDTPRRSVRISEKAKVIETPEHEPPKKKRESKSSLKKAPTEEKDNGDGEDEAPKEGGDSATTAEGTKDSAEVEMKEAENAADKTKEPTSMVKAAESEDGAWEREDNEALPKEEGDVTAADDTRGCEENKMHTEEEVEDKVQERPAEHIQEEEEEEMVEDRKQTEFEMAAVPSREKDTTTARSGGGVNPDNGSRLEDIQEEDAKPKEVHSTNRRGDTHIPAKASPVSC